MESCPMMVGGGGIVMIGVGLVWVLVIITLLLVIAALIKYLRSGKGD